ncbi:DJ-1 domain, InhA-type [Penicillium expansum]|uniref:DJ-1 domain, InhA-type n=1 Tax=Penicillium expansum TaxID=27334 RepID=A0A0A2J533_PENEN|nr:DJ-1 domain, InhA-type [Penicillium expansum]KAJ5505690.1 DJ-1 domain InhA-type [Penicillium expansum]KGO37886.1 DJ-1 domain, InhA-type [Penicillium expansum]KGO49763.1 DJ-1 domain, InhA-type [Penicillium expansum]KGO66168.1 DJ-1 domain, InhA-type [Penicillium expansum]
MPNSSETTNDVLESQGKSAPLRVGVVLFPGFQALDVFGPLDCINVLSWTHGMTLALVASTLEPVTTKSPISANAIGQSVVPTHTFATAPSLDLLFVPGGLGTRVSSPAIEEAIVYIRNVYPQLSYLITVCTGAGLAARAGVLDGRRATTNKMAWAEITGLGVNVDWVPRARWVVDGNVWSSSGVSAGIDVTLAWIEAVYGSELARTISNSMEYTRHEDPNHDPFAELHGL